MNDEGFLILRSSSLISSSLSWLGVFLGTVPWGLNHQILGNWQTARSGILYGWFSAPYPQMDSRLGLTVEFSGAAVRVQQDCEPKLVRVKSASCLSGVAAVRCSEGLGRPMILT
jgi:hypothetical protein